MRRNNTGKVILIILAIVALCGFSYLLSSKIVSSLAASSLVRERLAAGAPAEPGKKDQPAETKPAKENGKKAGRDPEGNATAQTAAPGLEHCYIATTLSPDMQENFRELCLSLEAFEEYCALPHPCSKEDAAVLMSLLHNEQPKLFQFDSEQPYYSTMTNDRVNTIEFPYSMGMTQYLEEKQMCEEEVARIVAIASRESTDYDRELAAYREYCRGAAYDMTTARCSFAVGSLVEKRAKCDGISLGFKWVMDELGIPCVVISGDNKIPGEVGHSWNMVMIDGVWYCLDVTAEWSLGPRDGYLYPAVNISEDWQYSRYTLHEEYDGLNIPHCTTMEGSYHVKNGSYVPAGGNSQETFFQLMDRALAGNGICLVQIESAEDWDAFTNESAGWSSHWLEERNVYGNAPSVTVPDYHVAEIRLEINENSGRMNELLPQIDAMKADLQEQADRINDKNQEIANLGSWLNGIWEELEVMQQEGIWDDERTNRYNRLADEYNAQLEQYNQMSEEYSQMIKDYNADNEELQRMINEYNSMVVQ